MMIKITAFLVLLNFISSAQTSLYVKFISNASKPAVDNFISDKISSGTVKTFKGLLKTHSSAKLDLPESSGLSRIYKIDFKDEQSKNEFIQSSGSDQIFEYLQEPSVYKIDYVPNDSLVSEQWALQNIQAFDAWEITQGSPDILIGLIDTGIDYKHPDLKKNLFVNSAEDLNGNGILDEPDIDGIDNDGNGFIDDVIGWDFTDRVGFPFNPDGGDYLDWDNDPFDDNKHGTLVAGVIGAQSNNLIGIAGVVPNAKIINLRAFDPDGFGEEDDVAAAIVYAVDMGVKVINMSFGDDSFSYVLKDVIKYAYDRGVMLVGSSGNSSSTLPHYPSSYSEVISVGASTDKDFIASFSNTGSTIDLVAPGLSILTTSKNNSYSSVSGTSFSTPFVTGASALLLSLSSFTSEELKQILKSTSDDIESPGWDLRSGAGRLNLKKALQIAAPSEIKFISPGQDYATMEDTLHIVAEILSPYFLRYNLYYGMGLNPENWNILIENGQFQFTNKNIYNLDITGFPDTSYTLRMEVVLTNGRTMEERVNFHIDRTPPNAILVNAGPAFYGEKSTLFASMFTDDLSVTKMFYRVKGTSNFNFISLDGFSTNNKFVKQLHYGFIPKSIIQTNTTYEIYFEAENLVGLVTTIKNNQDYFELKTDDNFISSWVNKMEYTLPPGRISKDPAGLTSNNRTDVLINAASNSKYLHIFKKNGNSFIKVDSIKSRIAKSVGDFNFNGKEDVLSLFNRNGFIDEQIAPSSTILENKFSDTTGAFWSILADDIDDDGFVEVLSVKDDTTITVYQVDENLNLSKEADLINFSDTRLFGNDFHSPSATIADINNDGIKEIWTLDSDGDLISFNIAGPNFYTFGSVISTDFLGSDGNITSGDFDGDGREEVAVLLRSFDNLDIAPFYILFVFSMEGNSPNLIFNRAFIDPSIEFNTRFRDAESGIRFAQLDTAPGEELVVFAFPYAFIFNRVNGKENVIYFKEGVNSHNVFIGDLNQNGINELALPFRDRIEFYEFSNITRPGAPNGIAGYSIDSSSIRLTWNAEGSMNYIYRGLKSDSVLLIDSTANLEYIDNNVINNSDYYYAIQTKEESKEIPLSIVSNPIKVFSHQPAYVISAGSEAGKNIIIKFSNKILTTIENLDAFNVENIGIPNSASAGSQFSYILNYSSEIPEGNHRLFISQLRDLFGSFIEDTVLNFAVTHSPQEKDFYITNNSLLDVHRLKIIFNIEVDKSTASNLSNYIFNPLNAVEAVEFDPDDNRSIIVTTKYPVGSVGKEYVLNIENLTSSSATGSIRIKEGAGSFVVISSFANNLDEVYVYPNPVRLGNSDMKMTFANLTKNAEIIIFNLNGKRIKTIFESDGNGGAVWDMRDENGDLVGTGIYFYRVVSKDDSKNDIQEKIEKFAVIR